MIDYAYKKSILSNQKNRMLTLHSTIANIKYFPYKQNKNNSSQNYIHCI